MLRKIFITVILFTILGAGGWYIYEKYVNEFSFLQKDVAEIVFAENIFNYSPYTFVESNNQRLRLIYEPLVKIDKDLAIIPGIANSFGRLDEDTWEFTLNPQVTFHDGTPVRADIIEQNFINYKLIPELKNLISSIDYIEKVNELTIHIKTKYPDASLLNKLSLLYIAPNIPIEELITNPIGTGPYIAKRIQKNKLSLIANPNYYGRTPVFPKLVLTTISDQFERNRYANETERVIMVYPVAAGFADQVSNERYNLVKFPTTSVNFFLFNFNRPTFRDLELRKFFNSFLSNELIVSVTDELGVPVSQFVSEGVFGYNPEIYIPKFVDEEKLNLVKNKGLVGFEFKIALPVGLDIFKQVLETEFNKYGILPSIELIDPAEILSVTTMQNFDLIFLGWKSDYADAISLFENLIVTNAGLNLIGYSDAKVDNLILSSQKANDSTQRQELLKQAMHQISIANPVGIPLFESETIYAVDSKYEYLPRVDGYIDPNNLRVNIQ
jgi:peptide/nickel transport system substrate-binding protein